MAFGSRPPEHRSASPWPRPFQSWRALIATATLLIAMVWQPCTAAPVDWKFYGGLKLSREELLAFFDADGLIRRPDGHIEVWTKSISQSAVHRLIEGKGTVQDQLVKRAAQRIASKYVLPYGTVDAVDSDLYIDLVTYEVVADIGNIDPEASILYEINCSDRILRELSLFLRVHGKTQQSDKPLEWKHAPPESNAANLLRLACQ